MRSNFYIALIFFSLCLTLNAVGEQPPTPKIKIGVILALTGDNASIGNACRNGIQLAYDGLPPELRNSVELFFEDDKGTPAITISAWQKLRTQDGIQAVIGAFSGSGNALAPLTEKQKFPFISIASDPHIVESRHFVKILWVTPEDEIAALLPEIKRLGYTRIARVSTIHDGALSVNKIFDSTAGSPQIVLSEEILPSTKDFRPFLTKLKNTPNVDAVMASLMPGHPGLFTRQARELGINLPIFGWEAFEDPTEVKESRGALIGKWFVSADDPDPAFIAQYRAKFPDAALIGAANAHDALLLLVSALAKSQNSEEVVTFLDSVKNFKGALGTISARSDGRFALPAAIKVVTATGFEKVVN